MVRVTSFVPKEGILPAFIYWENVAPVQKADLSRSYKDLRIAILDAIARLQYPEIMPVHHLAIAQVVALDPQSTADHLDYLRQRDYIRLLVAAGGHNAFLLSKGRLRLEELRRKEMNSGVRKANKRPDRIFISHGRSPDWQQAQRYIENDIGIDTLELAEQPSQGRFVLQKLDEESEKCNYAVVVMTGDDRVGDDEVRVRENVMHEIGFFQGRFGIKRVCLLYEKDVNVPANISGLVYASFPKGHINAAFVDLRRDIEAAFPHLKK
jgi:Predicted nucleotide-binding protein containing TIR-like domain